MADGSSKRQGRDWLSIAGMAAVAGAAAFTSYSGWAGLAEMAGWNHLLAKFLPITVDAYAMTATRVWLSPAKLKAKARTWARNNAIGAIATSVLGNAFYHAAAAHVLSVTWPVVVALSAVPPIALGLTTHLWHLADDTEPETEAKPSPGPAIADPDAVRAAYPILGNPGALALPASSAPSARPASAPGRASAPGARSSAPRPAAASARRPAAPSAPNAAPIARSWAEREAQLLPQAAEINKREIAAGNGPVSARTLAKELRLGHANAGKLIKTLGQAPGPASAPDGGARTAPPAATTPGNPTSAAGGPAGVDSWLPGPTPQGAPLDNEAQPAPSPQTPATAGASTPGPLAPGALPPQREAPIEHANGASTHTP